MGTNDDKLIEVLKILTPLVSPFIGLLQILLKQDSFRKKRFLIFKEIREEYLNDKVNGYYYFQSFLNIRLPKKETDPLYLINRDFSKLIKQNEEHTKSSIELIG